MMILSFALTLAGVTVMAMVAPRHVSDWFQGPPPISLFRLAGLASMAFGLMASVPDWGLACGLVLWTGQLSVAGVMSASFMSLRRRFKGRT